MATDVREAAARALAVGEPGEKARAARRAAADWREGRLSAPPVGASAPELSDPARPARPALVPPGRVPRRRLNTPAGRFALMHAIAHIEFNAIDLALDMTARFSADTRIADADRRTFIGDWIGVADDEARHFTIVRERLRELGGDYGDLPAHDGLWEAARNTSDDLAARLAVAPLVLEARGLDVTPGMIERLESAGDRQSAAVLKIIYREEIAHVAAGARWFEAICKAEGADARTRFHALVRERFKGGLKPPFNNDARERAGLAQDFYTPLAAEAAART